MSCYRNVHYQSVLYQSVLYQNVMDPISRRVTVLILVFIFYIACLLLFITIKNHTAANISIFINHTVLLYFVSLIYQYYTFVNCNARVTANTTTGITNYLLYLYILSSEFLLTYFTAIYVAKKMSHCLIWLILLHMCCWIVVGVILLQYCFFWSFTLERGNFASAGQ